MESCGGGRCNRDREQDADCFNVRRCCTERPFHFALGNCEKKKNADTPVYEK